MNPTTPLLMLCALVLGVAALALALVGRRQPRYRGGGWWIAALCLSALGAGLAAFGPDETAHLWALLLLMPWPVLTVIGMRRFHARQGLPGREGVDWLVLAAALAFVGMAYGLDTKAGQITAWAGALVALALHGYAAALLFETPRTPEFAPLRALGAAIAAAALVPALTSLPAAQQLTPLDARAVATALAALVLAFAVLSLRFERTERRLRSSRRRLRVLANIDTLTQVPNRRHFNELVTAALHVDPPGSAMLLVFDIDHFKRINDQLGHAAGDVALRIVAHSVLKHLRVNDVGGRHGGDEFVLLLRRASTREAMGVAGRIVAEVQRRAAAHLLPQVSLSFGMVQVGAGETVDDALRRADQALYEAKRQGRSRAVSAVGDEARPVFGESQRLGLTSA